jgi:hypothetical protein
LHSFVASILLLLLSFRVCCFCYTFVAFVALLLLHITVLVAFVSLRRAETVQAPLAFYTFASRVLLSFRFCWFRFTSLAFVSLLLLLSFRF